MHEGDGVTGGGELRELVTGPLQIPADPSK